MGKALVFQGTTISGEVVIGDGSVIHPTASIIALPGSKVVLGINNVVEERVVIKSSPGKDCIIGDSNLFQVGSGNVLEVQAALVNCTLGNGCVVGTLVTLPPESSLPNNTIVYGPNLDSHQSEVACRDPQVPGKIHLQNQRLLIDILTQTLPKFHQPKG